MTSGRSLRVGEGIMGVLILGLGLFVAVETALMAAGPGVGVVGPALFPYLTAAGLIVVGALILREAGFGHIAHERGMELDWKAVATILLGLTLQIVLLPYLGWILATAILFTVVARAFGSRRLFADVGLGLLLSAGSFALFNYGLDLSLPAGPLERLGL